MTDGFACSESAGEAPVVGVSETLAVADAALQLPTCDAVGFVCDPPKAASEALSGSIEHGYQDSSAILESSKCSEAVEPAEGKHDPPCHHNQLVEEPLSVEQNLALGQSMTALLSDTCVADVLAPPVVASSLPRDADEQWTPFATGSMATDAPASGQGLSTEDWGLDWPGGQTAPFTATFPAVFTKASTERDFGDFADPFTPVPIELAQHLENAIAVMEAAFDLGESTSHVLTSGTISTAAAEPQSIEASPRDTLLQAVLKRPLLGGVATWSRCRATQHALARAAVGTAGIQGSFQVQHATPLEFNVPAAVQRLSLLSVQHLQDMKQALEPKAALLSSRLVALLDERDCLEHDVTTRKRLVDALVSYEAVARSQAVLRGRPGGKKSTKSTGNPSRR